MSVIMTTEFLTSLPQILPLSCQLREGLACLLKSITRLLWRFPCITEQDRDWPKQIAVSCKKSPVRRCYEHIINSCTCPRSHRVGIWAPRVLTVTVCRRQYKAICTCNYPNTSDTAAHRSSVGCMNLRLLYYVLALLLSITITLSYILTACLRRACLCIIFDAIHTIDISCHPFPHWSQCNWLKTWAMPDPLMELPRKCGSAQATKLQYDHGAHFELYSVCMVAEDSFLMRYVGKHLVSSPDHTFCQLQRGSGSLLKISRLLWCHCHVLMSMVTWTTLENNYR